MFSGLSTYFMKDFLSLYFAFIIVLISIPMIIYSLGYVKEYKQKYSITYFWIMMMVFIFSMLGVILSGNCIVFMVFWEIMSVSSFFLVIYDYYEKINIQNGIIYFIMTHISGLLLMFMFALIGKYSGSMYFSGIISYSKMFTTNQKSIIIILAVLGFGAKAGLIPLHAWLPKAHPSAPSNISALMSGVMLKIALYGFIRVAFMFMKDIPVPCEVAVMLIGALTAIFSIINALYQNDIKKLLAYSSAENIGIIFSTLGISMIFNSFGLKELSVIALAAALFHILNHAVFKSLLFSSAGSVLYATGTKNMNELGGLHKKLKLTAYCAFIGTAAISAIPPLNGFASETLILKSFIQGAIAVKKPEFVLLILASGILLAFTSGGVLWCSVKSFAMTFLGEPRTEKAVKVHEVPAAMNIGMIILSVYSVVLGILSPLFLEFISKIAANISVQNADINIDSFGYEITIIAAVLTAVIVGTQIIFKFSDKRKTESNITWGCGFNKPKAYIQYSPDGLVHPSSRVVGQLAGYKKEVKVTSTVFLRQKTRDLIDKYIYENIIKLVDFISQRIIKIHYGKIQIYISYIFIALIFAIVFVLKFV